MRNGEKLRKNLYQNKWEYNWKKENGIKLIKKIEKLKDCGIGRRFEKKTFFNFDRSKNLKAFEACRSYTKNFSQNKKEGRGLFLYGNVGTGKTHLVVAIVDRIARLYKDKIWDIRFTTGINLISEIKASFTHNDGEKIIYDFKRVDLLVIDDFGTHKTTDWTEEIFYSIVDWRYQQLKPLIITTNLSLKDFREKNDERMISRILEMCSGVKFTGKDHRIG